MLDYPVGDFVTLIDGVEQLASWNSEGVYLSRDQNYSSLQH